MKYLQVSDFKNKPKIYLDLIENGSSFILIKRGRPFARISPISENKRNGWKREIDKITLKNKKTTLEYIVSERAER